MFLFSEYLRELIQEKQMSISLLARLSGVERTLLSKSLTGQRVLPYHVLDELIFHLKLTPNEEKLFRRYYDAQFEKEGIRQSRELIGKMFNNLTFLDFSVPTFEQKHLLMNLEEYAGERSVFIGETNVQFLLRMVLSEEMSHEDALLELTVPPLDTFLMNELLHRCLNERMPMEIRQIIAFDTSGAEADINLQNLEYFCQILPICLLSRQQYHPYYYYTNSGSTNYADPFPYFLVTHSCVVCLSEDAAYAMLLQSEDAIAYYRRHFKRLTANCYSLIHYTKDPLDIIKSYQKCTDSDGFYVAMDQPCFARSYSDEIIVSHIRKDVPDLDKILSMIKERFGLLKKVNHFYTFFSETGLKRFMEDGNLDDHPKSLVLPFTPEERVCLMKNMVEDIKSEKVMGRIWQEKAFPNYLAMCTSEKNGVGFFTTGNFRMSEKFCSVWIREPNLCKAFHSWLTDLSKSSLILTEEETLKILGAMIPKNEN